MNSPSDISPSAAEALDAFLRCCETGQPTDRAGLLARFPELAPMLDCLEELRMMAQPVDSEQTGVYGGPIPTPSQAGRVFGKYEVLSELGRGGMGVVYKAQQSDLGRIVALKMILSNHLATAAAIRRFHAEARAAARLRHPNIVPVYDTGEIDGQCYFAMEFIEGPSLGEILKSGPMASEAAAELLCQLARAVHVMHQAGIIHRDLKPGNVLMAQDVTGRPSHFGAIPKITDFGLAKVEDEDGQTASGAVLGTPSYMAPEQAAGRTREVGPRSDIYSLGAILYACLTGQPPFKGESPMETVMAVLESEPELPRKLNPSVPKPLELICLKCLAKSPGERYNSAENLANDLEAFLAGEPVSAQPSNWFQSLVRWARREPALAAHWAGLGLAAAVLQVNFHVSGSIPTNNHLAIMGLLLLCGIAAWLCQRGLRSLEWAPLALRAWSAADVVALTAVLGVSGSGAGPPLIIYPLLIAAAGLWFEIRLVWFMTLMSQMAFTVLVLTAYPREALLRAPHHPALFLICLGVLGGMIAYQVHRTRALLRFPSGSVGAMSSR